VPAKAMRAVAQQPGGDGTRTDFGWLAGREIRVRTGCGTVSTELEGAEPDKPGTAFFGSFAARNGGWPRLMEPIHSASGTGGERPLGGAFRRAKTAPRLGFFDAHAASAMGAGPGRRIEARPGSRNNGASAVQSGARSRTIDPTFDERDLYEPTRGVQASFRWYRL